MRLLTLSAAVVVALTGCQTTSQPKLSETEKAYLNSYKTPSYIQRSLIRMNESSFKMEYTEAEPLKGAYLCGLTKSSMEPVDGPITVTYYAHGQYKLDYSLPTPPTLGQCTLNKHALLQVRTDAVKVINAHMTAQMKVPEKEEPQKEEQVVVQSNSIENLYKQYGVPTPEEQEKQRVAAAKKREQQRLKDEAYAKSPKKQMDSYSLATSELKVCADNYLIRSRDAKAASANLLKEVQGKLGKNFDKNYFDKRVDEQYKGINKLLIVSGVTSEMRQACRYIAASNI